jgi:hypothetical protein
MERFIGRSMQDRVRPIDITTAKKNQPLQPAFKRFDDFCSVGRRVTDAVDHSLGSETPKFIAKARQLRLLAQNFLDAGEFLKRR